MSSITGPRKTYLFEYFDGRGNGEIPRLVFVASNQEFEDKRLTAEWPERKLSTPMGQLPVLTVTERGKDDIVMCQSTAIATYLAKALGRGLYGKTFLDGAIIDETYCIYKDIFQQVFKIRLGANDEEKNEAFEKFSKMVVEFNRYIGTKLYKNGRQTKWTVGDKMTLADLVVFHFVDMEMLIQNQDYGRDTSALLRDASYLMAVYRSVGEDPYIRKWLERRPQTAF